jgi:hypothetical protein
MRRRGSTRRMGAWPDANVARRASPTMSEADRHRRRFRCSSRVVSTYIRSTSRLTLLPGVAGIRGVGCAVFVQCMKNLQTSSTTGSASSILGRADADLLRRVVPGSPESLGRFYDAYAPRLFLFVSRAFPGDAASADAAMEDVFWCVWKELATRPDGIAEMDLWLRKIVGACCRAIRTKSLPSAIPGRGPRLLRAT